MNKIKITTVANVFYTGDLEEVKRELVDHINELDCSSCMFDVYVDGVKVVDVKDID